MLVLFSAFVVLEGERGHSERQFKGKVGVHLKRAHFGKRPVQKIGKKKPNVLPLEDVPLAFKLLAAPYPRLDLLPRQNLPELSRLRCHQHSRLRLLEEEVDDSVGDCDGELVLVGSGGLLEEGSHREYEICTLLGVFSLEVWLSDHCGVPLVPIATNAFAQLAGVQVQRRDHSHLLHDLKAQTADLFLEHALPLFRPPHSGLLFGERGERAHADAFIVGLLHHY